MLSFRLGVESLEPRDNPSGPEVLEPIGLYIVPDAIRTPSVEVAPMPTLVGDPNLLHTVPTEEEYHAIMFLNNLEKALNPLPHIPIPPNQPQGN